MLELLKEIIIEYQQKFEYNNNECTQLMKDKKPWKEKSQESARLILMIESIILEIQNIK